LDADHRKIPDDIAIIFPFALSGLSTISNAESSANTPPKPSKKIGKTMSISENPVRRSNARPMRPAQPEKEIYCAKKSTKETL
jgi:hypothetical protein